MNLRVFQATVVLAILIVGSGGHISDSEAQSEAPSRPVATMGDPASVSVLERPMVMWNELVDGSLRLHFDGEDHRGQPVRVAKEWLHQNDIVRPLFIHENGARLAMLETEDAFIVRPPHFSFILVLDAFQDDPDREIRLVQYQDFLDDLDSGSATMTLLGTTYSFDATPFTYTIQAIDSVAGPETWTNLSMTQYNLSSASGEVSGVVKATNEGPVIAVNHDQPGVSYRQILAQPTLEVPVTILGQPYIRVAVATFSNISIDANPDNDTTPPTGTSSADPPGDAIGTPMAYATVYDQAASDFIQAKYGSNTCQWIASRFPFTTYGFSRAEVPVTAEYCIARNSLAPEGSHICDYRDAMRNYLTNRPGWGQMRQDIDFAIALTGHKNGLESRGCATPGPVNDPGQGTLPIIANNYPARYAALTISPDRYANDDPWSLSKLTYEYAISVIWQHEAGHIFGAEHWMVDSVTCEYRGHGNHYPVQGDTLMGSSSFGQSITAVYCPQFSRAPNAATAVTQWDSYSESTIQVVSFIYDQDNSKYW